MFNHRVFPAGRLALPLILTLVAGSIHPVQTKASDPAIIIHDAQLTWVDDVEVASRDDGVVVKVNARPSDQVTTKSLLVELDDRMQVAGAKAAEQRWSIALEESENDIDARLTRKQSHLAKTVLDRGRDAVAKYEGAMSQSELEKYELDYEQALLSEEQAAHELAISRLTAGLRSSEYDLAQLQLQHRKIHSPLNGQVVDVTVQVGEWVSEGDPIARIVNPEKLRIVALMPEKYIYSVKLGQSAEWKMHIGDTVVAAAGQVSFVSPEVNPVNGEFTMWVDVDNTDGALRAGFVGTLTLDSQLPK